MEQAGYIDYGEPQSHSDVAANNPLTAGEYRNARKNDDYYTMASIERGVRDERRDAEIHPLMVDVYVAFMSIFIICLIAAL